MSIGKNHSHQLKIKNLYQSFEEHSASEYCEIHNQLQNN